MSLRAVETFSWRWKLMFFFLASCSQDLVLFKKHQILLTMWSNWEMAILVAPVHNPGTVSSGEGFLHPKESRGWISRVLDSVTAYLHLLPNGRLTFEGQCFTVHPSNFIKILVIILYWELKQISSLLVMFNKELMVLSSLTCGVTINTFWKALSSAWRLTESLLYFSGSHAQLNYVQQSTGDSRKDMWFLEDMQEWSRWPMYSWGLWVGVVEAILRHNLPPRGWKSKDYTEMSNGMIHLIDGHEIRGSKKRKSVASFMLFCCMPICFVCKESSPAWRLYFHFTALCALWASGP